MKITLGHSHWWLRCLFRYHCSVSFRCHYYSLVFDPKSRAIVRSSHISAKNDRNHPNRLCFDIYESAAFKWCNLRWIRCSESGDTAQSKTTVNFHPKALERQSNRKHCLNFLARLTVDHRRVFCLYLFLTADTDRWANDIQKNMRLLVKLSSSAQFWWVSCHGLFVVLLWDALVILGVFGCFIGDNWLWYWVFNSWSAL